MNTQLSTRQERIEALAYDYAAQPKEAISPCNLCGADRWVILTHRDRYGFPAQAACCGSCGMITLQPRMTSTAYGHFYESVYRPLVSAYHGRQIDAKTIQSEQVPYAEAMAELAKPFLTSDHRTLLDVGGSTGIVAAEFVRAFGLKATIIDPAPAETAEAEALGIESVTGFVEDWDPEGRTFDVVGLFQTIDHLLDVRGTLAKLRQVLSPTGWFLFDIVDFRAAYLRHQSVEEGVKIDHVYSLTQETTEAFLARAGFEWVRKSYSPDYLHVAYVCRPCEPQPNAMPDAQWVKDQFSEIRRIQNAR